MDLYSCGMVNLGIRSNLIEEGFLFFLELFRVFESFSESVVFLSTRKLSFGFTSC